jgi:Lrp/AsnC family transcriptional regulator, leucine-responsive regulatory protein
MELDEVDRKILGLLKGDARMQFAEIGKRVSLSAPAVHARVKKMEAGGVISRYTVDINPTAVGASLCAFIRIQRNKGLSKSIAEAFLKIKQIEECHAVAGEDCLIVKLRVESSLELSKILDQVRSIDGIDRTVTAVVLETHFERGLGV